MNYAKARESMPGAAARMHKRPKATKANALTPAIASLLCTVLVGCASYVPGRQSFWDQQVAEMCKKDGGVHIVERVRISRTDIQYLGGTEEKIAIPSKSSAHPNAPVYSELHITYLRQGNPQVSRAESVVMRRADGAVVARWINYSRRGGDVPSPSHDSVFSCPDLDRIRSDLRQLFIIKGESE